MKVLGIIVLVLLFIPTIFFFSSWVVMLVWGALGNEFGFATIGWWRSCLVTEACYLVSGFLSVGRIGKRG